MVKAIVFDLDGMVYLTTEMFSTRYAREFNLDPEIMVPFFKNQLAACQKGEMDLKEELDKVLETWKWTGTVDELLDYWFDDGQLNDHMLPLISELKEKGVLCGLCTNNEKYRLKYLKEKYDLGNVFDFIVTSYETGHLKPEKEIFDTVLEKINLSAGSVLVCDDKEKHVETLSAWEFVPYIYKNQEEFEKKLEELKVL
jgi:HAD superfamily hydrolase (TIGR01509 family)